MPKPLRLPPAAFRGQDPALMKAILKITKAVQASGRAPTHHAPRLRSGQAPRTTHAYIVGGFVRDLLLKQRSKDADLEVYGLDAKALERLLKKLFPKSVNAVGKSFGVFKVRVKGQGSRVRGRTHKPANSQTRQLLPELDVSLPRRESKTAKGHKGFSVHGDPEMPIREAARRRDFTMNAILFDPATREIVDPFGGVRDLKARTLRVVDPMTFADDPLRVWRALQFAARFGLEPDPKTTALLRKMVSAGATDELPKERVTEELRKLLLLSERPSVGLELARIIGLAERDLPELHAMAKIVHDAGAHREGTAWVHTLLVIDATARIIRDKRFGIREDETLTLMLAAVCHDFGKAVAKWTVNDHHPAGYAGHAEAGAKPAVSFMKRFAFGDRINRDVVTLTRHHRRGGVILGMIKRGDPDTKIANELRKLIRDISPVSWNAYLALSAADTLGLIGWDSNAEAKDIVTRLDRIVKKYDLVREASSTLLAGRDLVRMGVPEGPEVGRLLTEVERARDDGRLSTRREALELAKMLAIDQGTRG
jgi:tRNA nucleotidyltransferase (CCA-adding enzyme)